LGQRWVALRQEVDRIVIPFGAAALKAAAPQPGEHVIDIGCGCGDTAIEIARLVGSAGSVLGLDVSKPMLEVARSRGMSAKCPQLSFREADASVTELPADIDLLFSRFGVMFFSRPSAAFGHLRTSLRPGGRCVFVCWRAPRDNAEAPGPFAFADEARLRAILSDSGFGDIELQRFDAAIFLGPTPRSAAEGAVQMGPVARLVRETGAEHLPIIVDAIEEVLTPLAAPNGH